MDAAAHGTGTDAQGSTFLEIRDLWKRFGDFVALEEISLAVREGEFVCFLGPSGCGKTTLLRAIAGLDPQTLGSIAQSGRDISALPPSRRDYGIVFQSYALFPNLTVRRNVAYGLENTGMARGAIEERVAELLALVGLPEQGRKYPAQLSGGQQQRVALARAIASRPGLLLLDEPLSALDAKVRVSLRHQIKELQRRLGVTTIMVTHDQEEGLAMADRIVVMNHGRVEQVGTPAEIYRDPLSLFVADFIGEMNQCTARVASREAVNVGDRTLACLPHGLAEGAAVIATIRPEDIVPHATGENAAGNRDRLQAAANTVRTVIRDMEFLGAYWRAGLDGAALGCPTLTAALSANAVRRMNLGEGSALDIELPPDRLKVFASAGPDAPRV